MQQNSYLSHIDELNPDRDMFPSAYFPRVVYHNLFNKLIDGGCIKLLYLGILFRTLQITLEPFFYYLFCRSGLKSLSVFPFCRIRT